MMPMSKEQMREACLRARKEAAQTDLMRADALIADELRALPAFNEVQVLLSYLSFGREVDTERLIEEALAKGVRVALPRITGARSMAWHEVRSLDGLVRAPQGMLEPAADDATRLEVASLASLRTAALVPGLAFDASGYRIGYGGGFYDRFLPSFREAKGMALGLCRASAFQEEPLPRDAYDAPVDLIVTEKGVHRP